MTNIEVNNYHHSKTKRIFDLVLSLLLLLLLFPLFLIIAIIIKIDSSGPVLFKQKRHGKNKSVFTLYKFRTMRVGASLFQEKLQKLNEAPLPMFKIKNDPRFTKVGRKLSQYGLDELPQLFNILMGQMSLIGPRPFPVNESEKLDKTWLARYSVKPGIISHWALNKERHKNLKTWKKLELETLTDSSLLGELKLLVLAFWKIIIKNNYSGS